MRAQEDQLSLQAVQVYGFEAACVPLMEPKHHSLYISALKLVTSVRDIQGREPGVTTTQQESGLYSYA